MSHITKRNVFFFTILLMVAITLGGCGSQTNSKLQNSRNKEETSSSAKLTSANYNNKYPKSSADQVVDKVQIYYFHRTQRCSTCLSIGRFTGELVAQKFADEIDRGIVDFKEINVELAENRELANKFKASGPSLFFNEIKDDEDNISEDVNIWRFTQNENQFKSYLENKINTLLGK